MEQTYQIPKNCWLNAESSNVCLAQQNAVAIGFFSINWTLLCRSPNLRSSVSHMDTESLFIQSSTAKSALLSSAGDFQNGFTRSFLHLRPKQILSEMSPMLLMLYHWIL